jgi:RsiW-degrading membrane proteinase PrsW (M82 family)
MITNLPNITILAVFIGFIPSVLWLAFWLSVDRKHHEPKKILLACFVLGAVSVLAARYIENFLQTGISNWSGRIFIFAAVEEFLKFLIFYVIAYNGPYDDEPIEPAMYMIVTALGFAALENILYMLQPNVMSSTSAILLTGTFRFFGSTLLHALSSGFIGIMIGITKKRWQSLAIIGGLVGAILLHGLFNLFIFRSSYTMEVVQIYCVLLTLTIISHIVLEKLRTIPYLK